VHLGLNKEESFVFLLHNCITFSFKPFLKRKPQLYPSVTSRLFTKSQVSNILVSGRQF
jgi:hypothetical protein